MNRQADILKSTVAFIFIWNMQGHTIFTKQQNLLFIKRYRKVQDLEIIAVIQYRQEEMLTEVLSCCL